DAARPGARSAFRPRGGERGADGGTRRRRRRGELRGPVPRRRRLGGAGAGALPGHDGAGHRRHRRGGLRALAAFRLHGGPPRRPHPAGGADRAGADRLGSPRGGAGELRLPDRLAQDRRPLLEARGVRGRQGRALGGGQGGGRRGGGPLGARRRRERGGL
ncbi:MAG: Molybdopterin synthase catalytic subunit MoaE, partial [uncultured Acetobacteraceae bacterium]